MINNTNRLLATTLALLIVGTSVPAVFAAPGENEGGSPRIVPSPSDLLPIDGMAPIFFGNGGYSADGCGTLSSSCTVDANVTDGAVVEGAWLYAATQFSCPATVDLLLDGTPYTLPELVHNTFDAFSLCSYRAEVTDQVEATIGGTGGITTFTVTEVSPSSSSIDGTALVVVFSDDDEKQTSVIVLDGGLDSDGQTTTVGLAAPLDKTVPDFEATLALGINFGAQSGPGGIHKCGTGQFSEIDINDDRLTSCAGHNDDGDVVANGALITVGGVGDDTNNPPDPNGPGGEDDELYNIADFLDAGITSINMTTVNPSDDDNIFLAIFAINAKASLEICDNGIDDDLDGLIDLEDPDCIIDDVVGGEFLPMDMTSLFVAGLAGNLTLLAPIAAGIAGAGIYIAKTRMNKD